MALFVLDRVPRIGLLRGVVSWLGELTVSARRVAADPQRLMEPWRFQCSVSC
jgi:hypothetical protein